MTAGRRQAARDYVALKGMNLEFGKRHVCVTIRMDATQFFLLFVLRTQ